jgi:tetratricopeptide (TPR) repeat protein
VTDPTTGETGLPELPDMPTRIISKMPPPTPGRRPPPTQGQRGTPTQRADKKASDEVPVPTARLRSDDVASEEPLPDYDLWRDELAAMGLEAEALRAREHARAALMYGAIGQLAGSVIGDSVTGADALARAGELSRERWILMFSRREAACDRDWPRVLELLRAELPMVGEPHERVALLLEIAVVEELISADLGAARRALEEAHEIDPAHAAVLEALSELYLGTRAWANLVGVLEAMADATVDVAFRSMLRHSAGLIHEVALENRQAARSAYKLALADDPRSLPAAASLASLALIEEDWPELARALMAEAEMADEPPAVRRLAERAGDIYWERLGDAESAVGCFRRAVEAMPAERSPLHKLAAVLESTGRWRELSDVYAAELPLIRSPLERADLLFRIGEVKETNLGGPDEAVSAYRDALEAVPTHRPTLQALGALYRSAGRYAELAQMDLREAERLTVPERRAARYYEVAELYERRLGDQAEAILLYERCFEVQPGHRAAFDALDRLYRREGRYADLVSLYERQATATSEPALLRMLKLETGRLWRERVPNEEKAAAALRDALAIDTHDLSPIVLLSRVLEASQKWEPLVAVLERLAGMLTSEVEVIATLQRMAVVFELHLGQDERALDAHHRVLERDPNNEVSLRAVGQIHFRAGRWVEVVETFRRQLDLCSTSDEAASTLFRIGRIFERKLGRRDDALLAYESALDRSPTYLPAFRALEQLAV